jgi:hypothetical protein
VKAPPGETSKELIARFGMQLAEEFKYALQQVKMSLSTSEVPAHIELREYLNGVSQSERELLIAQHALEYFVHDFMAELDESDDFKIIGTLKDGTQFDLRELCPGGLHGNQFDWIEDYAHIKDIYTLISEKESSGRS